MSSTPTRHDEPSWFNLLVNAYLGTRNAGKHERSRRLKIVDVLFAFGGGFNGIITGLLDGREKVGVDVGSSFSCVPPKSPG